MHRDVFVIRGPGLAYWTIHRDTLPDGSCRWGAASPPPPWVRWGEGLTGRLPGKLPESAARGPALGAVAG